MVKRDPSELASRDCIICGAGGRRVLYESTIIPADDGVIASAELACTSDRHSSHHRIVRCRGCGFIYADPRESDAAIESAYGGVIDDLYVEERDARVLTFTRSIKHLEKHCRPGKLLDAGCHVGVFLDIARKRGWRVSGVEPSSWAAKKAKELYGLDVRSGTFDAKACGVGAFDAVTLWDVVEHLTDPLRVLAGAHDCLKDGGILALSTMDAQSLFARVSGRRWPWLMRMHLYYFSPKSITALLEKTGFEVVEIRTYVHIISVGYLLKKIRSINETVYKALRLLPGLSYIEKLHIPFTLGDFMEVYARKVPPKKRRGR